MFEVQTSADEDEPWTWPLCVSALAEHLAVAALRGSDTLPSADADTWRELIVDRLGANRSALSSLKEMLAMDLENWERRSKWFQNGKDRGRLEGQQHSLVRLLAARGLACDDRALARIQACDDRAKLDRWLTQAITAASVDEALR